MELVALIVGLGAAAVVTPAIVFICATRRKETPVGASMANRRGAPPGKMQIDPILQPDWAMKQAARQAQEKKQLTVIMSSKQARLHKASTSAGGVGGGNDDHVRVVMRQPSTMADKFALPSHLTKQLGQASRRTGVTGTAPAKDGSVEGVPPPLWDRKSQSPPLQRTDMAPSSSLSASISRSAINDSSINVRTSAGGEPPDLLYGRQLNSSTSLGSHHRGALGLSSLGGPDSSPMVVPVSEMYPLDGSVPLRDLQSPGGGSAWPLLNEGSGSAEAARRDSVSCQVADSLLPAAAGSNSVAAGSPQLPDGPRVSHPRVAALSPMLPRSSRLASGDGSLSSGRGLSYQQHPQDREHQEDGQEALQLPSSDNVERLVRDVDWSAAAVGGESGRRSSYAMGTAVREGMAPVKTIASRQLNSALETDYESCGAAATAALAPTTTADAPAAAGGNVALRQLLGSPATSNAGRTISSRELHGRTTIHLPSPLGSRSSFAERETRGSSSGGGKRWTANGGLTPPAPAAVAFSLEAQLPGSTDSLEPGASIPHSQSDAWGARSQRSMLLPGGDGGRGGSDSAGGRGCSLDRGITQTALGTMSSADQSALLTSAAAAAAAAAAVRDITKSLSGANGDGGGSERPSTAVRTNLTWSGMAVAPLVDVEAGTGALTSAVEAQLGLTAPGGRAARAKALLARNRNNLSRLALATAAGSSNQ